MPLSSEADALKTVKNDLYTLFHTEQERVERIDRWLRWDPDSPHAPKQSTKEYQELAARSATPYLRLVVSAQVRSLYVDGYRQAKASDESAAWEWWQRNGMDRRQIAIHRAAVGYGLAYTTVLPGMDTFGESMPIIRGVSPRRMMAFYDDPADDDWPRYAVRVDDVKVDGQKRKRVRLYDDASVWYFDLSDDTVGSSTWTFVRSEQHNIGVCPVVRYVNQLDLEGRASGEVEPFIATAARIDQTTFDRLVVQRFSSWVVRTIAGMSVNETTVATGESPAQAKMRLRAEDILVAEDPDTRFGTLDATPLDGFIKAKEADVRDLSAVSSTPAHELLGQIANLSAEALMAAEISHDRKTRETSTSLGQSHEQTLRLAARVHGDTASAKDMASQVRWQDTSGRSFAAMVDGLVKLKELEVPNELLWESIPGYTQQDVLRAKALRDADPPADPPAPEPAPVAVV